MAAARVTITMDKGLLERARDAGNGNFSRFVSDAVLAQLERMRREKLRESLVAGAIEDADLNLQMCREWDVALQDGLKDEPWEE